jgi:hypothetical protein
LPYWVAIESPVAVPELADLWLAVDVAVAVAEGVAAAEAAAVRTAGECGWKASTPAAPATVAVRTIGDRRKAELRFRR